MQAIGSIHTCGGVSAKRVDTNLGLQLKSEKGFRRNDPRCQTGFKILIAFHQDKGG